MSWLLRFKDWLFNSVSDKIDRFVDNYKAEMFMEVSAYLDDLFYIASAVAIVGMFFLMAGERKFGTKLVSFTFLVYLLTKVVMLSVAS